MKLLQASLLLLLLLASCRSDDEPITPHQIETVDTTTVTEQDTAAIKGFFLLNEGNMGSNKCTLDYYDATEGRYVRNIFGEANPGVVQELGDVGNDLQVYDGKLWAVVNCSHFVEVMDVATARHITQISIPNCRYIAFSGDYAYVTSYAGPVQVDPNARRGYVSKIDVRTLQEVDTILVGYQPDELSVVGGKLFVANSGGYRVPLYDRTVSVIDLKEFRVERAIDVAPNLHRTQVDSQGKLWVSSRGDYFDTPSKLFVIDPATCEVVDSVATACSNMTVSGDSLFVYGTEWSYVTNSQNVTYAIIDTRTRQVVTTRFITDDTDSDIEVPYGVAVNPDTHEFYVTDAGNYVSPGRLYCFSPEGRLKWSVRTGDIPAHFAFTRTKFEY